MECSCGKPKSRTIRQEEEEQQRDEHSTTIGSESHGELSLLPHDARNTAVSLSRPSHSPDGSGSDEARHWLLWPLRLPRCGHLKLCGWHRCDGEAATVPATERNEVDAAAVSSLRSATEIKWTTEEIEKQTCHKHMPTTREWAATGDHLREIDAIQMEEKGGGRFDEDWSLRKTRLTQER